MTRLKSILAMGACALALSTTAQADSFNIPAGDLNTALSLYIRQSGAMLSVSDDAVKGIRTKGVKGDLPAAEALTRILSGTGFVARDLGGSQVIVRGQQSNLVQPLQLAQAAPSGRIEEVLVTARRREEAVQDIPISITALNAEDLKTFGVRNIADLEGIVPGLNLGGGGNGVKKDMNPFIRGIGQRETKVTLDPAVGTYLDGIYIGRPGGSMFDTIGIESIQVLRGPQGTLFGRNTTGGAISITTQKPNNEWTAQVTANIGNYGRRDLSGFINIPIIDDTLAARLTISAVNSNGYFTNVVDNSRWNNDNRVSGFLQLRYTPTDDLTFDILAEKTRVRERPRPQRCQFIREAGFVGASATSPYRSVNNYRIATGEPTYEAQCRAAQALPQSQFASDFAQTDDIDYGQMLPDARYWNDTTTVGMTGTWDAGTVGGVNNLTLKSISAYRKVRQIADEDLDATASPQLMRVQLDFDETWQVSQELQLSGSTFNDRLFFSTGLYYFKEKTPQNELVLSATILSGMPGSLMGLTDWVTWAFEPAKERLKTDNTSYAWYGQVDFDITPEIELSGGLRWTKEKRWSRYEKAYGNSASIVNGFFFGGNLNGLTLLQHTMRGINPFEEWVFGYNTWSQGPGGWSATWQEGVFIGDELTFNDEAWTPMVSLKYKPNAQMLDAIGLDEGMIYATYSRGYHSGGVTAGAAELDAPPTPSFTCHTNCTSPPAEGYGTSDPIIYKPEYVDNYEVGMKFTALDHRLQGSLNGFYMNYTDMQVTAVGLRVGIPVPYIDNVGKSVIKGIEAEFMVLPTPEWRIMFTGSYTDADIKEWVQDVTQLGSDARPFGVPRDIDRSDEPMPRVPRWQAFVSSSYTFNLGSMGSIIPTVSARYTSPIYHGFDRGSYIYTYGGYYYNRDGLRPHGNANNPAWIDGDPNVAPGDKRAITSAPVTFFDARLAWISEDGKMEAALWGKNLTNKDDYLVGGIPLPDILGSVGQIYANPRTFGLTFTYHFGQ